MAVSSASLLATGLRLGSLLLRNRVFVAPMSGVSDLPFRRLAYAAGAGMAVAEMAAAHLVTSPVSGAGHWQESRRRLQNSAKGEDRPPAVAQLVGREPRIMAQAARIAADCGAQMIDINMGCPAKKLAGKAAGGETACGAALMRDEALALRVIEAVVAAVGLPVSVKMRLGWDKNTMNAPRLARQAEQAGAAMITVHARTREQFYQGQADWAAVRAVREQISVPLIINGDIDSRAAAQQAIALSGADGVMIGRAGYGQPWLAGSIAGHKPPADIAAYSAAHYRAMLEHYGLQRGLRHARKHMDWYIQKHAAGCYSPAERAAMLAAQDPACVEAWLARIFARKNSRES